MWILDAKVAVHKGYVLNQSIKSVHHSLCQAILAGQGFDVKDFDFSGMDASHIAKLAGQSFTPEGSGLPHL